MAKLLLPDRLEMVDMDHECNLLTQRPRGTHSSGQISQCRPIMFHRPKATTQGDKRVDPHFQ